MEPRSLSENVHLPFDKLTALSKVEELRYTHPSSLQRTHKYASFLRILCALHLNIFQQPPVQNSLYFLLSIINQYEVTLFLVHDS